MCECTNPACVANKHGFHSGSRECDPLYPLHGKICKKCNDQHRAVGVAIAPTLKPPNKSCGFCSAAGGMQNLCLCRCGGKTRPNPGGEHYFHITPTAKIAACQSTLNPAMCKWCEDHGYVPPAPVAPVGLFARVPVFQYSALIPKPGVYSQEKKSSRKNL